jgi:hypothetical protein
MTDRSLAEWLGEPDDEAETAPGAGAVGPRDEGLWAARPPRRAGRLWLLAVVPWVVIAVGVVVLIGRSGAPEGAAQAGAAGAAAPADGVGPPADGALAGPDDDRLTAPESAPAGDALPHPAERADAGASAGPLPLVDPGAGLQHATSAGALHAQTEALALAAVHLLLTGSADGAERYVELAAVERVTPVAADSTVLTVLAVVLEGADGAWTSRRPVRLAVPVRDAPGVEPAVLGTPWPLPAPPDLEPERPEGAPDAEPATAAVAVAALEAAGYEHVEVEAVARLDAGLLRATVTAVPPGEAGARRLEPWLADQPSPRLLGLPAELLDTGPTAGPQPPPAPAPPPQTEGDSDAP